MIQRIFQFAWTYLESLDRVYLNVYQPELQTPWAVFHFLRDHYGQGAVADTPSRTRRESSGKDAENEGRFLSG